MLWSQHAQGAPWPPPVQGAVLLAVTFTDSEPRKERCGWLCVLRLRPTRVWVRDEFLFRLTSHRSLAGCVGVLHVRQARRRLDKYEGGVAALAPNELL
eukprot:9550357-Alexandrium_andersonii.AAC.1